MPGGTQVHCTTSLDPLQAEAIAAMPVSVRLIANIGVGIDNIDLAAARERGIAVSNTPVATEDTADLAFALILAACRRVGEGERFLRGGNWTAAGVAPPLGMRVHGKGLGLVGFGAIAQAVARRARGFDRKSGTGTGPAGRAPRRRQGPFSTPTWTSWSPGRMLFRSTRR
ncbi:hypothetical protein NO357_04160 [Marimonas arenosa]|uniref:D-isomer specific 2-hydroxyacid dehydrogenase catalytic domain-containing protein n=1 Tax=Marimonas arenosa TaxID=1795305 RepID=A0AAE3WAU6_9RHOB|nr:hypothetical protein [Marimonas arenosa]